MSESVRSLFSDPQLLQLDLDFRLCSIADSFSARYLAADTDDLIGKDFIELCRQYHLPFSITDFFNYLKKVNIKIPDGHNTAPLLSTDADDTLCWEYSLSNKRTRINLLAIATECLGCFKRRETTDYLQYIINNVPHYIFWKNVDSVFLGCNKLFALSAGLNDPADIIGKTDYQLPWSQEESELYVADDQAVMAAKIGKYHIEEPQTSTDGSTVTLLTSKVPLFDENHNVNGILGIYTDITAIKKTEEKLIAAKQKSELANQAKTEFIANMTHDIRTPLAGIVGAAELIAAKTTQTEVKNLAKEAKQASDSLLTLLNDVLDFSRIEAKKDNIKNEAVPLQALLTAIIQMMTNIAQAKGLELAYVENELVPLYVKSDDAYIKRILINLISNAIKFTKKGTVSCSVELVEESPTTVDLCFTIKDTGIGIPADKLDSIFDRFSRVSASSKGENQGVGLGLTITKSFIESLGGRIVVESILGAGSEFRVYLSFDKPSHDELQAIRFAQDQETQRQQQNRAILAANKDRNYKVLLVEDHPLALHIAKSKLEDVGCQVNSVTTGLDAVSAAQTQHYDLIFMDIGLPDISGLEAAEKIRAFDKKTPIVALTAHLDEDYRTTCLLKGFNELLGKPLQDKHVNQMIVTHILHIETDIPPNSRHKTASTERIPLADEKIIDVENGARLLRGDAEIVYNTVNRLLRGIDTEIAAVEQAYADNNYEVLGEFAHRLAGACAYAAVPKLQRVTQDLERALLDETDEKVIQQAYEHFFTILSETEDELERCR